MKILGIIGKSFKEQVRSYWVLLLSLSMGPFFIFVYFLITESSRPHYAVLLVNNDKGTTVAGTKKNYGSELADYMGSCRTDTLSVPFTLSVASDRSSGLASLRNRKADALIVVSDSFSVAIEGRKTDIERPGPEVEFTGDLTSAGYLISAVWAGELLNEFVMKSTGSRRLVALKETPLGNSSSVNDFDMIVPGILIVSLIMLMFTASIAFVSEVENKTIMRLKLSGLTAFEFLTGITVVQLMVGLVSVLLTLLTAIVLGFNYAGSLLIMILIAGLTSLSIIAFSLIIAAVTRSANEVLVVGNFPMFLFMFFTGAAFPLRSKALFTIAGYPVSLQGLMTPSHAISALNKTLIMNMDLGSIMPELISIVILTALYFLAGGILFRNRHLRLV